MTTATGRTKSAHMCTGYRCSPDRSSILTVKTDSTIFLTPKGPAIPPLRVSGIAGNFYSRKVRLGENQRVNRISEGTEDSNWPPVHLRELN